MSRPILVLLACLALLAAGCGKSEKKTASQASTTATSPSAPSAEGCAAATPQDKGDLKLPKPTSGLDKRKRHMLELITSCGEIDIALDVRRAPRTTSSVAYLARKGFYDGLSFHRVAQAPTGGDFVIQGGDPSGTGNGGPGYSIKEAPPKDLRYTRGVVAMAKTEIEPAGTSGSQFFIVTAEDAGLPPDYALLGKVVKGDDVVSKIAAVPTDSNERPTSPVVIRQAKVVSG